MRYTNLDETLTKVLTTDYQMPDEEANRIAADAAKKYVSVVLAAGSHYEEFHLWHVTLKWHAFCGRVVHSEFALSDDRFAGLPLVGALRWLEAMSWNLRNTLEAMLLNHIEAATCMALWKQEAEAQPHTPDDTPDALLNRANAILTKNAYEAIDAHRLHEAMERLRELRCLTSRNGFYRLKEELKYEVLED